MTPKELREARKKLGLLQDELYVQAGLGVSKSRMAQKVFVSRMEHGARTITDATAQKVLALMEAAK